MTRTTVELDDQLLSAAMARFGLTTKRAVVELALRRLVASPVDGDFIRSTEGMGWDGDLESSRTDDLRCGRR